MLTCVTDLAFGDTGKGKIIDAISPDYDIVVRFNGGPNAGHTVVVDGEKHVLHHLPSGIFSNVKHIVLSGGMVVNPVTLTKEIQDFGFCIPKLMLSDRIHCIMPWHIDEDIALCKAAIGTTSTGIGPCYADKMYRTRAVRLGDLFDYLQKPDRFMSEMASRHRPGSIINGPIDNSVYNEKDLYGQYNEASKFLQQFLCDDASFLREAVKREDNILFESANGIHLDIDHGGYPFVTSSGCGPAFIPQSCGLPNLRLDTIIGITKSYITRVGTGKLDTELNDSMGESIRRIGNEFGATTGRPRRIGWLDLDIVSQGIAKTGATDIAITHLDTLVLACKENNRTTFMVKFKNQMHELDIWETLNDSKFNKFLDFIKTNLNYCKISYLGTGRDRKDLITCENPSVFVSYPK